MTARTHSAILSSGPLICRTRSVDIGQHCEKTCKKLRDGGIDSCACLECGAGLIAQFFDLEPAASDNRARMTLMHQETHFLVLIRLRLQGESRIISRSRDSSRN